MQVLALAIGAAGGAVLCRGIAAAPELPAMPVGLRAGLVALAVFVALLVALPIAGTAAPHSLLAMAGIFYKAGALVFGGGHVVLPLLRDALVPTGWLSDNAFLAGYGVAQAVPGPLFTFSAYLGAVVAPAGVGTAVVGGGAGVHVFAGAAAGAGRAAVMGLAVAASCGTWRAGWGECRGGGGAGGGAVRPDLGQRGGRRAGCGDRRGGVRAAGAVAGGAGLGGGILRGGGRGWRLVFLNARARRKPGDVPGHGTTCSRSLRADGRMVRRC